MLAPRGIGFAEIVFFQESGGVAALASLNRRHEQRR
jgi:hypothetical protein